MKMARYLLAAALLLLAVPASAQTKVECGVGSNCVIKAGPGQLIDVYVTPEAVAGWLFVINTPTAPSDATLTPGNGAGQLQDCVYVPANISTAVTIGAVPGNSFSSGIALAFSSTACPTLTQQNAYFFKGRYQ